MEIENKTIATTMVKNEDLNKLLDIAEAYIKLEKENTRLKLMLVPKDIDMEKYNKLDLSDIDLSKADFTSKIVGNE